jgi:AraC-like DNA-binding protein
MYNELEDDLSLSSQDRYIHTQILRVWHGPLHVHKRHLEILLVLEGRLWIKQANRVFEIPEGELAFMNIGDVHGLWSDASATVLQTHLDLGELERFFPSLNMELFGNQSLLGPEYPPSATARVRAVSFQRYLIHQYLEVKSTRRDIPSDNARRLVALLQAEFNFLNHIFPSMKHIGPEHLARIQKTFRYIRDSYREKLTLETLASHEGITSVYFTQMWKDIISIPLHQFINRIRALDSERELLVGEYRLLDLALAYGFSDERYYCKDFKRWFGERPLDWKKRWAEYGRSPCRQEVPDRTSSEMLLNAYKEARISGIDKDTRLYGQYRMLRRIAESQRDTSGVHVVFDLFSPENLSEGEDPCSLPEWNSIELLLACTLEMKLGCCIKIRQDAMRTERLRNGFYELVKKAIGHEGVRTINRWKFLFVCKTEEELDEARSHIAILRKLLHGCTVTIALE